MKLILFHSFANKDIDVELISALNIVVNIYSEPKKYAFLCLFQLIKLSNRMKTCFTDTKICFENRLFTLWEVSVNLSVPHSLK